MNHADDVVICGAVRTPFQRSNKGAFKLLHPEDLLTAALKGLIAKTGVKPRDVQDIVVGTVLTPGGGATVARMAAFKAGFPSSTSLMTVNRQCSSGLQAVASIVEAIKMKYIDVGIGAGMESMTLNYASLAAQFSFSSEIVDDCELAANCLLPMGETAENVAEQFNVDRESQDRFALSSHQKAAKAQRLGLFDEEIVPVSNNSSIIKEDDGIRADSNLQTLSQLKPAFRSLPQGTATAGNSSQISDGAAAVLLARRSKAQEFGLPILAVFRSFAVVGVEPHMMGIGPAVAIPIALDRASISLKDIGIFEINEAFASQCLYCIRKLKIDEKKVNPKGGAIAFGHPLGATGARQIATLLPELRRQGERFGVVSMCVGTGMGVAAVIELERNSHTSKL